MFDYVLPAEYLSAALPTELIEKEGDVWVRNSSDVRVFDSKLRNCLRALSSPKLSAGGGFRYRRSKQQAEIRDSQRWHNYYHNDAHLTHPGSSKPPVAATLTSTQLVAQRAVEKFTVVGGVNSKYKWTYHHEPTRSHDSDEAGVTSSTSSSAGIPGRDFMTFRISGDGFLTGQIQSMVGVLICVMQGWLPFDFIAFSQRPDVIIETPLAPKGLLFLSETRYDWHSNRHNIFDHKNFPAFDRTIYKRIDGQVDDTSDTQQQEIEKEDVSLLPYQGDDGYNNNSNFYFNRSLVGHASKAILHRIVHSESTQEVSIERWMTDMREVVCPRIRQKMDVRELTPAF